MITATATARVQTGVDALLAEPLERLDEGELLGLMRAVEVQRRRLAAVDHALIAEVEARGVAPGLGVRDTATLLRQMLRVSPGEASARVRAAADLGPRRELTGEPLEPLFAHTAAAQREGAISAAHARTVVATVWALPETVQAEQGNAIESELVGHAQTLDPVQLGNAARRLLAYYDPDGVRTTERDHERRREATLSAHADGSGKFTAHLTPAALAVWQAVLDPLAAPVAAVDGTPDPRTARQRRHDGFLAAGQRLLRAGALPVSGGMPATVAVTIPLAELERRTGLATTAHGGLLSVGELLALAAESELIPVVLGDSGGVMCYGRSRRTASAPQRRALAARDGGCSFPGCSAPAAWAEAHHVISWLDGGTTDLANLTLACGYHHRGFERLGWACRMRDGVPEWVPPSWIDPERRPQRNARGQPPDVRLV